jgi:hypothetical protein
VTGGLGTPAWDEITGAVGLALGGDRDAGAVALRECWARTSDDDHAQRCVLAHYLADLEPDLDDEIAWDERALAAYAHVGEGDLAGIGIPHAGGMAPSLHLNLGELSPSSLSKRGRNWPPVSLRSIRCRWLAP